MTDFRLKAEKWLPVVFRHANDGLNEDYSRGTGLAGVDDGMTVQAQKEDSDINVIMKRYTIGGQMPQARAVPQWGDFSGAVEYQDALERVRDADASFMSLPAEVRSRFDNDPGKFLEFIHDDENLEEARKLGILEPEEPVPPPMRVEVVAEADSVEKGRQKARKPAE